MRRDRPGCRTENPALKCEETPLAPPNPKGDGINAADEIQKGRRLKRAAESDNSGRRRRVRRGQADRIWAAKCGALGGRGARGRSWIGALARLCVLSAGAPGLSNRTRSAKP